MAAPKNFDFSSHALHRACERGISHELMIEVVKNPDKRKQQYKGTHGGFVYLFSKKIDGRELQVAAELYKDECFLVTAFWP